MHHGFTLLEMLLVMALIGLLASVAYPSYHHHEITVRRHHANILLLASASRLEMYYNTHNSYLGATLTTLSMPLEQDHYRWTLQITDAQHYVLQAIPQGSQAKDPCGILQISETGPETKSLHEECW